jgi:hypothetical protein
MWQRPVHNDEAVRTTRLRMGCRRRSGHAPLRHLLLTANEGHPHLSAHGKSSCRAALAWPHENREHGPVSRHRGR